MICNTPSSYGCPTNYTASSVTGYSDPFACYALPLNDQHWYADSPVRATTVVYRTVTKTEKSIESRKQSKRDGTYYIKERTGREVRVGKLRIKRKILVNHHPDNTFDALFVNCEFEGETEAKWIVIPYRAFIKREILQYLHDFHRNVDCPDKYIISAFYQELLDGDDTKFLDLPQQSGWQLVGDKLLFASSATVIPQLAPYYAPDIPERRLMRTDKKFGDASKALAEFMPECWQLKALLTIRIASDLLFFYADAGLVTDQIFLVEPNGEASVRIATALLKNRNCQDLILTPLLSSKTSLQSELDQMNDDMVVFRSSSLIEDRKALTRSMDVLLNDLNQCSGSKVPRRHIIAVLAENPGSFPPELPAYQISLRECPNIDDIAGLQQAAGELECSLIHLLSNSDRQENLISWGLERTKYLPETEENREFYSTERMLLSTAAILNNYGVITLDEYKKIARFLKRNQRTELDSDQVITNDFYRALSVNIETSRIRLAKQYGSPYFDRPRSMAVLDGKHLNFTQEMLDTYIIPRMTTTQRRNKLLHALDACGKLHRNNNYKRNIDIEVAPGITKAFSVYSVPLNLLTPKCREKINAFAYSEYLFAPCLFPLNFQPIVRFSDTKAAGRVVDATTDEAESIYASGQTRSGKSYFLVQQALIRAVMGNQVVIFDQTGAFTPEELRKHLPDNAVEEYFTHFDLCKQGLPVDLLTLEGCDTLPEKKNRLSSVFSVAGRITGEVQGKALRKCLPKIAKAIESGQLRDLPSALCFFDEEDEEQAAIKSRLEDVFDDLEGLPMPRRNWGEFLNAKKIVVISTADDGIRKTSQLIDMLLASLYTYKQHDRAPRYAIVLDEIEDLILEKDGPIGTILRKGAKHGLSMLLASQEFSAEKDKLGKIIGNCGLLAVFRPKDADLSIIAKHIGVEHSALAKLEQGEFFAVGGLYNKRQAKNRKTVIAGKAYPAEQFWVWHSKRILLQKP